MSYICARSGNILHLGRQGENLAREIAFDEAARWPAMFGDGHFELIVQRPGEETLYPVDLVMVGDVPVWRVSNLDTALASTPQAPGSAELRYMAGAVVVKSQTYQTMVTAALGGAVTDPPDPAKPWVDSVMEAAQRAEEAVGKTPYVDPATGTWWQWDAEEGAFVDTGVAASGGGGVMPALGYGLVYDEARKLAVDKDTVIQDVIEALPAYQGSYEATPAVEAQSLPTAEKYMAEDVQIKAIPYYEVSNEKGGETAIIGGSLDG